MSQIDAMAKQLDEAGAEIARLRSALEEIAKSEHRVGMLIGSYDAAIARNALANEQDK